MTMSAWYVLPTVVPQDGHHDCPAPLRMSMPFHEMGWLDHAYQVDTLAGEQ